MPRRIKIGVKAVLASFSWRGSDDDDDDDNNNNNNNNNSSAGSRGRHGDVCIYTQPFPLLIKIY